MFISFIIFFCLQNIVRKILEIKILKCRLCFKTRKYFRENISAFFCFPPMIGALDNPLSSKFSIGFYPLCLRYKRPRSKSSLVFSSLSKTVDKIFKFLCTLGREAHPPTTLSKIVVLYTLYRISCRI